MRSYAGLTSPLDYNQGAPIGFLLLVKASTELFGRSEYALRLVPFIFGIVSVLLFYRVARDFIVPSAVPLAVALFAILPPLVYYSSEVKQYSGDVMATLLLLGMARPFAAARAYAILPPEAQKPGFAPGFDFAQLQADMADVAN